MGIYFDKVYRNDYVHENDVCVMLNFQQQKYWNQLNIMH